MSEIASRVKAIIVDKLGVEESEVTNEASFTNDLGADSLDLFELTMALEEEYDTEIPAEELEDIETVGDVIEYLREKGKKEVYCLFAINIFTYLCSEYNSVT